MRIAWALGALGGLFAWASLFLPWWYISGLGPTILVSPLLLFALGLGWTGGNALRLSEGFSWMVNLSTASLLLGGLVGTLRGFIKRKIIPLTAGLLLFSSIYFLTETFNYLKVDGAILCRTTYLYGAPIGYGISYGYAVPMISGILISSSVLYEMINR